MVGVQEFVKESQALLTLFLSIHQPLRTTVFVVKETKIGRF